MENQKKILVTGAGGFIGHHLVRYLKAKGYWIRGVDIKYPEFSSSKEADEFLLLDLRDMRNCQEATRGIDEVYALAANMGGIGFITEVKADILRDNVLINSCLAEASRLNGVKKIFYASSACVYPNYKQSSANISGLKESDAYPADPDSEYGWEKLFSERLFKSYYENYGLETRIGRFHNIFGPEGTYEGGREKAPAAIARKIALAEQEDVIEVWGDGEQTRSFCYISDCLEGIWRLMQSNYKEPLNIGSDRLVTINQMVDIIAKIAGKKIAKKYLLEKPQGVRGRNSDNALCRQILGWAPSLPLEEGLKNTYFWIKEQINQKKSERKIIQPLILNSLNYLDYKESANYNSADLNQNQKKKINIIGYGFVGQSTAIGLKKLGYDIEAFDIVPKENIYKAKEFEQIPLQVGDEIPESGVHIICIADKNLPDGRQEISHISHILDRLNGKGEVILRTTMLPRFLASLKFDFYWPEFLHEKNGVEEFLKPDFVVVGKRKNDKEFPFSRDFSSIFYCTPEEASHIKYLSNIWNALKIAFVNEFGDNLNREAINRGNVIDFFFKRKKYFRWGNSFGGHCLPKDTQAYIREYPHLTILKAIIESNFNHKKQYPELENSPIY